MRVDVLSRACIFLSCVVPKFVHVIKHRPPIIPAHPDPNFTRGGIVVVEWSGGRKNIKPHLRCCGAIHRLIKTRYLNF